MLSQVQHWLSQMHVPGTCAMTPKAGIVKFHRTQGLIPSNLTNLTQILCVVWSYLSHVLHLPTLAVLHQRFGHVSVFHHKGQFPELIILHLDDGGPVPISEDFSWPPPQNTRFTVCHHGFTCLVPWRHQSSASQTTNSYQDAGSRTHQAGPRPRPFHKHSPGGCLLELEVESEADHWHLDCTNYRPLRKPWQKLSRSTSHWSLPQNVPRLAQKKQQCTVLQCPKHRRQMPNCPTAQLPNCHGRWASQALWKQLRRPQRPPGQEVFEPPGRGDHYDTSHQWWNLWNPKENWSNIGTFPCVCLLQKVSTSLQGSWLDEIGCLGGKSNLLDFGMFREDMFFGHFWRWLESVSVALFVSCI